MDRRDGSARTAARVLAVAVTTFALGELGTALSADPGGVATWAPASGFAVAVLLLWPGPSWPAAAAAVGLGLGAAGLVDGHGLPTAVGLAAARLSEVIVAALVAQRLAGGAARRGGLLPLLRMLGATTLASNAVTALLGAAVVHADADTPFATAWLRWTLADGLGMLLVVPAALALENGGASGRRSRIPREVEAAALALVLAGVIAFVFARTPETTSLIALPYLCLPPLTWAALRFGTRGAAASGLVLATGAGLLTAHGRGPFAAATGITQRVVDLQAFLVVASVGGLLVALAVDRRRRAEEELQRSNGELERYAATVSHDLVVPLRTIEGFVELLLRDAAPRLDAQGRDALGFVASSAQHLRQQVSGLLELARAGSHLQLQLVASKPLVERVVERLDEEVRAAEGTVELSWLPTVVADPVQLDLVFTNLISNALKFAEGDPPHVRIEARRADGAWCFSVLDNGPGIDRGEAEHVFGHGRRGAGAEGVPGSGLGLAIVRRVVEAHGGRVWVEPGPQGGSRFAFLLPAEA